MEPAGITLPVFTGIPPKVLPTGITAGPMDTTPAIIPWVRTMVIAADTTVAGVMAHTVVGAGMAPMAAGDIAGPP